MKRRDFEHALKKLREENETSRAILLREKQRADYIMANMAEGLVWMDADRRVLLCNNSARALFGVGPGEIENLHSLTRNPGLLRAVAEALEGRHSSFELALPPETVVNAYVSPTGDGGATLLLVDITAQKKLEEQKRDFFQNASHELRTPVTSIRGFAEMLNHGLVEPARQKEMLQRIEAEASRLCELINDILAVSRLETNQNETGEFTVFSLAETVQEAAGRVTPGFVTVQLQTEALTCRADRREMLTLCVNLIENAVKYNKPGGHVQVTLQKHDGAARLTVKDTGIGIAPEYRARVFERFFRADTSRPGSGLGLAIVKHIVARHGGRVELESVPGEGTTFVVTLPVLAENY